MALIIMSHMGVVFQFIRRPSPWLGVPGLIPALSGLMGAAGGLVAPVDLQEAGMSAPNCSAAVHFRERQFEQGEWRGSLPINI